MSSLLERYDREMASLPARWHHLAVQVDVLQPERAAAVSALVTQQPGFRVRRTDARSGVVAFAVPAASGRQPLLRLRALLVELERLEAGAAVHWTAEVDRPG